MTLPDTLSLSRSIESLLTRQNHRGMDRIRRTLQPGYLLRTAQTLLDHPGNIFIVTGFPVAGTFETDGPAGALALYRLAQRLGSKPTIISDLALVRALQDTCDCHTIAGDIESDAQELFAASPPQLVMSIERPGASADGRYYNMAGEDISSACTAAEPYLALANCPTIAIGDGGNEVGMGNAVTALSSLNIQPAVSTVDELIVADVSNWAAYALCALTDWLSGHTPDSTTRFHVDLEALVARGAVDGVTREPTATEDGFPLSDTTALISDIAQLLSKGPAA
ncbi:MAG: hypothetical protein CME55_04180 [Halieaceae bacterium]|nr:hypothetical protein [Halieaceae bacterium]